MLNHNQIREIESALTLTNDNKCNAKVEDIMTHVRGLMAVIRCCEEQLKLGVETLEQRKSYLEGVIIYANEKLNS